MAHDHCIFCGLKEEDDNGGVLALCEAHGMCCDNCHDAAREAVNK